MVCDLLYFVVYLGYCKLSLRPQHLVRYCKNLVIRGYENPSTLKLYSVFYTQLLNTVAPCKTSTLRFQYQVIFLLRFVKQHAMQEYAGVDL